jgi:acyl carrier protein phosphodiesterase
VNFLAHFHLAWPDEQLIAGGLEGDFYKGQLALDLDPGMAAGIRLHRAIDAYTDQHRAVAGLRRQFPPQLRRFAGILIDLGFDHYLTQHWSLFSDLALERFNQQVYTILERHHIHLSAPARSMAGRLREYDVLGRYHSWDAVPASAARIGERFRRGNPLLATAAVLGPLRQPMEQAFLNFYPDLVRFSANQQGRCI